MDLLKISKLILLFSISTFLLLTTGCEGFILNDLYVQDNYCINDIDVKKQDILNTIKYSKTNTDKLVLNFTSCYLDNAFPPTYAGTAARLINPWFYDVIDNDDKLGIIVADFITLELAKSIYMRNIA